MKSFSLILNEEPVGGSPGLASTHSGPDRWFLVHAIRTGLMVLVLFFIVSFQLSQKHFFSLSIWVPVYAALILSFLFNGIYLLLFDWVQRHFQVNAALFAFDTLVITTLIYFTGVGQSLFVFLYLVNLILGGLIFQKRGGLYLGLWTSALFSWLMILNPHSEGVNLYLLVLMNNLAFFSIPVVSGALGEQLDFMHREISRQTSSLEALKSLNSLVVENIASGLMIVDGRLQVISFNQSAAEITGYRDLSQRHIGEVFAPLVDRLNQTEFKKGEAHRQELEWLHPRGDKLVIEIIVSALFDDRQEFKGYLVLFQDLTQVKHLERQMQHKAKLAAVGQLAAGIAHEIRNPLASISGSIQLLVTSGGSLPPEDVKLMNIVLKEIDRLNALISEFLDYVRPELAAEDPINVNEVLREALEVLKFNRNLRTDIHYLKEFNSSQMILGHKDKLKQAFLNILINAAQALEHSQSPQIEVICEDEASDYVVVKIRDNGQGMDPHLVERIFEPFHTTKPKGTGLGLAITHKILEMHQAEVVVKSEVGKGTEFKILFPTLKFKKELDPQGNHIRSMTA